MSPSDSDADPTPSSGRGVRRAVPPRRAAQLAGVHRPLPRPGRARSASCSRPWSRSSGSRTTSRRGPVLRKWRRPCRRWARWATTGSSARSAAAAWAWSTRPSRSPSAAAWPSRSCPGRSHQDLKTLARFRREARSAAQLHHTNIVPVFEVGKDGEVSYYAMQFIQGQGLDLVIDELRRLKERAHRAVRPGSPNGRTDRSRRDDGDRSVPCPAGQPDGPIAADRPVRAGDARRQRTPRSPRDPAATARLDRHASR